MRGGLSTPVVLTLFNRADVAGRVLNAIRAAQPTRLFVIADGPRPEVKTDLERCAATRAVLDQLDWPCRVERNFSATNLGPRICIARGLDWVFDQIPEAIILEHDCLPHVSFFRFCEELLERYRGESRVGMISGDNFQFGRNDPPNNESYYFSRLCPIWGWATWRRAWKHYDVEMKEWRSLRRSKWLADICHNAVAENYWKRQFDSCLENHRDSLQSWDLPWLFTCWRQNMLSIIPKVNLVSNIGFGEEAVHTRRATVYANAKTEAVEFPLAHPRDIVVNERADQYVQENAVQGITPLQRLYWKLRLPLPIWIVRRVMRWLGR